jgi:hypothetical protein
MRITIDIPREEGVKLMAALAKRASGEVRIRIGCATFAGTIVQECHAGTQRVTAPKDCLREDGALITG